MLVRIEDKSQYANLKKDRFTSVLVKKGVKKEIEINMVLFRILILNYLVTTTVRGVGKVPGTPLPQYLT